MSESTRAADLADLAKQFHDLLEAEQATTRQLCRIAGLIKHQALDFEDLSTVAAPDGDGHYWLITERSSIRFGLEVTSTRACSPAILDATAAGWEEGE